MQSLLFLVKYRNVLLKALALLFSVRIYNLAQLLISLYLGAFFIFNDKNTRLLDVLFDWKLHALVFISVLCMAAGTIINNFYDLERDKVIKPIRTGVQNFISQKFKLNLYLYTNFFALLFAFFISWRVLLYFFCYQFLLWFYSHKLNKLLLLNNITYSILSLLPFFALAIYYKNDNLYIFFLAVVLFCLFMILDLLKDLISQNIDRVLGYTTLVTKFGEKNTKYIVIGIKLFCLLVITYFLSNYYESNSVFIFISAFFVFFSSSLLLLVTNKTFVYQSLKLFYRIIIFLCIFYVAFHRFID